MKWLGDEENKLITEMTLMQIFVINFVTCNFSCVINVKHSIWLGSWHTLPIIILNMPVHYYFSAESDDAQ